MKMPNRTPLLFVGLLAVLSAPAFATVTIVSMTPSHASPQPIGKTITWTVTATDTNPGPLTFQFNIESPGGTTFTMIKDFNVGTLSGSTWTAQPFVWVPTTLDGNYKIQVVAKDFVANQSATKAMLYSINAVVTGSTPYVEKTANPLVALFSAPSCAAGSQMRVVYTTTSDVLIPSANTNYAACHPPVPMTFEVGGMYPSTTYSMYAETLTGGKTTNGTAVNFTTSTLPTGVPFPKITASPAGTDPTYPVVLHNFITFGTGTIYPDLATDQAGNIIWYYYANDDTHSDVLTRPLPGGGALTLQDDIAWNPKVPVGQEQFLRQIDLAGNVVRETNMGVIQQELLALGATDGGPCTAIVPPAPVGSACTGAFHHDAIATLPNGYIAALIDVEKIFPAGTQTDINTTLPQDIIGDMIIVLNADWQVVWYFDVFDPKGGGNGYPQLPVTRTAPLGEKCNAQSQGCPPVFLLDPNFIAPQAHDWLHANSLYYWPKTLDGKPAGDLIWSSRHQDLVFRIDYADHTGDGHIIWSMGPPSAVPNGDFTITNTWNDPWPWFSHQHDVGIENTGKGPWTLFDNGNTRATAAPPLGLGSLGCAPYDCDSRGMAFTVNDNPDVMAVTQVVSYDLGAYSTAMGSAQLLSDGNYFFLNPIVFVQGKGEFAYSMEISDTSPPAPEVGPIDVLMNIAAPQQYRGWMMTSIYSPPTT